VSDSSRRTLVLVLAWITAAVLIGAPGGAGGSATAQSRAASVPKIVHSGPECLAGHAAPPPSKSRK